MSIREVTMYRVVCDWPGCEASPQDDTENYAWTETANALDDVEYAGWWTSRDDDQMHYCPRHPHTWVSDDEPHPEPPYLLIDEDGTATLVGSAS